MIAGVNGVPFSRPCSGRGEGSRQEANQERVVRPGVRLPRTRPGALRPAGPSTRLPSATTSTPRGLPCSPPASVPRPRNRTLPHTHHRHQARACARASPLPCPSRQTCARTRPTTLPCTRTQALPRPGGPTLPRPCRQTCPGARG